MNYFYVGKQRGGWQRHPWMLNTIQELIAKVATLAAHRKHHERAPPPSMMLHQGISNHEWVPEKMNGGFLQRSVKE